MAHNNTNQPQRTQKDKHKEEEQTKNIKNTRRAHNNRNHPQRTKKDKHRENAATQINTQAPNLTAHGEQRRTHKENKENTRITNNNPHKAHAHHTASTNRDTKKQTQRERSHAD